MTPTESAGQAIDLFLTYRNEHGLDDEQARLHAVHDIEKAAEAPVAVAPEGFVRVQLSTICRASVHEEWILDVPVGTDLADETAVMGLLERQGDGVHVVTVENVEVYDETDRSFNHVQVSPVQEFVNTREPVDECHCGEFNWAQPRVHVGGVCGPLYVKGVSQ